MKLTDWLEIVETKVIPISKPVCKAVCDPPPCDPPPCDPPPCDAVCEAVCDPPPCDAVCDAVCEAVCEADCDADCDDYNCPDDGYWTEEDLYPCSKNICVPSSKLYNKHRQEGIPIDQANKEAEAAFLACTFCNPKGHPCSPGFCGKAKLAYDLAWKDRKSRGEMYQAENIALYECKKCNPE